MYVGVSVFNFKNVLLITFFSLMLGFTWSSAYAATVDNQTFEGTVSDDLNLFFFGQLDFDSLDLAVTKPTSTVASMFISSNYEQGWTVAFSFTNGGEFLRYASNDGVTDTVSAADTPNEKVPITSYFAATFITSQPEIGGTLGGELVEFTVRDGIKDALDEAGGLEAGTGDFSTGPQTSPTVSFRVHIGLGYSGSNDKLQGKYSETLTITLSTP